MAPRNKNNAQEPAVTMPELVVPDKYRLEIDVSDLRFRDLLTLEAMGRGELSFQGLDEILDRCVVSGEYRDFPVSELSTLVSQLMRAITAQMNPKN